VQTEPASAKDKPYLERRELGAVNIGAGSGTIIVDGESFELNTKDCLYIPMGSANVSFGSHDADNPAKFYLVSTPAHARLETKLITAEQANKCSLVPSKHRTSEQFISLSFRGSVNRRSLFWD
jgi:4-deoxy-L-threo-5-hexosulose-uronate ketol-isomerase